MREYRVVCINAKNKPPEVPVSSWIEKDEVYTVIGASPAWSDTKKRMVLAYKLKEVSMPPDIEYDSYSMERFRPYTEDDANSERALEELLLGVEEDLLVEI